MVGPIRPSQPASREQAHAKASTCIVAETGFKVQQGQSIHVALMLKNPS